MFETICLSDFFNFFCAKTGEMPAVAGQGHEKGFYSYKKRRFGEK